jgi:hypothetical protein
MISRTVLVAALMAFATASHAADNRLPYAQPWSTAADLEVAAGVYHSPAGHFDVFTTTGRASVPFHGAMNLEVQTTANTLFFGGGTSTTWMDAYAHAWHRTPSSAWGVFGGAEFAGPAIGTIDSVGIEAKHYLGNISLGGDAAYVWRATPSNRAWEVSATADVYFTPNHRIGLAAQYVKGGSTNVWDVRVDAEARLARTPWSAWAWAAHFNASGVSQWAALAGFRWYIDAPNSTLQSHGQDVPFYYQSVVPFLF